MLPKSEPNWTECQNGTIGLRMRLAWGRQRAGPSLPAPELHEITEEAAAAAETRSRDKDVPAPPSAQESTG